MFVMNTFSVILCVVLFFTSTYEEEMYTTKFDNIDYEEVLKSDRLLKNYANCLLDKGPCTQEGKELKRVLPDAISSNCSKCSEGQKKAARRVIQFLITEKEEIWEELMAKYDPDGEFKKKYENEWSV